LDFGVLLQAADDKEFLVDAATIWNYPVERWQSKVGQLNSLKKLYLGV
jgi:hypothetical protein